MASGLVGSSVHGASVPPPPASSRARLVRFSEIADATFTAAAACWGVARPCRPIPGPTSRPVFDMLRFMATGVAAALALDAWASTALGATGAALATIGFTIGLGGVGLFCGLAFF